MASSITRSQGVPEAVTTNEAQHSHSEGIRKKTRVAATLSILLVCLSRTTSASPGRLTMMKPVLSFPRGPGLLNHYYGHPVDFTPAQLPDGICMDRLSVPAFQRSRCPRLWQGS
jgi:hypothetical protein